MTRTLVPNFHTHPIRWVSVSCPDPWLHWCGLPNTAYWGGVSIGSPHPEVELSSWACLIGTGMCMYACAHASVHTCMHTHTCGLYPWPHLPTGRGVANYPYRVLWILSFRNPLTETPSEERFKTIIDFTFPSLSLSLYKPFAPIEQNGNSLFGHQSYQKSFGKMGLLFTGLHKVCCYPSSLLPGELID